MYGEGDRKLKLTEEYWNNEIEQLIAGKYNTMGRDFTSEDEEKLNQIKTQILDNEKIVDGIKQFYKEYKESEDAGFNREDRSYIFLQNLIHQTLSKNIEDL